MKIELDYDTKTIKLGSQTELKTFIKTIKRILPDWDNWILDTNTEIKWDSPIIIRDYVQPQIQPYIPPQPWWEQPIIYMGDGTGESYLSTNTLANEPVSGQYQLEIK